MTDWLERSGHWMNGWRRRKPKKARPPNEISPVVKYRLIACPRCGSRETFIYKTIRPVRYHKCQKCELTFKSVEE